MRLKKPQTIHSTLGITILSRGMLIALVVIPLVAGAQGTKGTEHTVTHWLEVEHLSPLTFLVAHVLTQQVFISSTAFCIAAGALFGPVYGTLIALAGSALGAAISFLTSRYFLSSWFAPRLPAVMLKIRDEVSNRGWRGVAVLRLLPFPFTPMNYTLGLTTLSLSQFLVPTVLCIAPRVAIYAYLGHAGREAIEGNVAVVWDILIALGVLTILTWLPHLFRKQ